MNIVASMSAPRAPNAATITRAAILRFRVAETNRFASGEALIRFVRKRLEPAVFAALSFEGRGLSLPFFAAGLGAKGVTDAGAFGNDLAAGLAGPGRFKSLL